MIHKLERGILLADKSLQSYGIFGERNETHMDPFPNRVSANDFDFELEPGR